MSASVITRNPVRRLLGATALALVAVLAVTASTAGTDPSSGTSAAAHANNSHGNRVDADVFGQDMRKLWEDHVTWTRLYIVSAIAGLPDAGATAQRLLQNQDDIGEAVGVYYGEEAGQALAALLRDHILIAADLIEAAKAGDTALVSTTLADWYANGDDIAAFLAAANPAWALESLEAMMRGHLDQTLAEATARLNGDWDADIAKYDEIHLHILHMADTLAAGIVEQFPRRFTR